MTRRVEGTLTDAAGTPLSGWRLEFRAIQSTPATVALGSIYTVTLDTSGGYDIELLDGRYLVILRPRSANIAYSELGLIEVTAGPDIDLLTLIGAPGIDQSDVQHLIDEALAYIAQAEDARDAAQLAETGAQGWSDLARDWATKTDGEVAPGSGYSAKHHAAAAASSALAASGSASAASGSALAASGSASTAGDKANEAAGSADLARDWAVKLGGEVAPGEGYSAKHHADAAAGSALAASGSASAASGSALAASGSAGTATTKAQDAADAADLAQDWATKTGAAVAGGEYSAKHHAQAAASSALAASGSASAASGSAGTAATKAQDAANAADLAQDWAEGIGEVEPGAYSAKHHAQEAATIAASTALATIDGALADRFERVTLYEDISALPGPRIASVLVDETNDLKQSLYWIPAVGPPQLVASSPAALDDAGVLNAVLATLFASGQSGAWYDIAPQYCHQDTAGTTPAAIGDPVGLVLDRSGRGNHASQTTATSRPILRQNATTGAYYLEFDGSDDFLVTNSIDFTSTDKMTVWAGVRKLSDAAPGAVAETSARWWSNSGTVALFAANSGATFDFVSRGTEGGAFASAGGISAPVSSVLTGVGSIPGDFARLRVDGLQVAETLQNQGTGNFGNHRLYIGRRAGTSLPFNGHLYGLLVRGAASNDSQIKIVERYLAQKTGVTLA